VKIFVASHRGLVGLAIVWNLCHLAFANLILRTRAELDLTHQSDMDTFIAAEKPRFEILLAAMVGGIHANNTYQVDFIVVKPRGSSPRCSGGGATTPRSCRGWPANQWGCRPPL
jgi:hypothetical protein